MLTKQSCTEIIRIQAHSTESKVIESLSSPNLVLREAPTLAMLYGPDLPELAADFRVYPSLEKPIDAYHDAFVIHSSGSTGHPKPVPQKFVTILNWMSFRKGYKVPRRVTHTIFFS